MSRWKLYRSVLKVFCNKSNLELIWFYSGFFCLGFPEVIYCHYSGDECHDAFITENLMDLGGCRFYSYTESFKRLGFTGFMTCKTDDLKLDTNGKDFLKASLGRINLT